MGKGLFRSKLLQANVSAKKAADEEKRIDGKETVRNRLKKLDMGKTYMRCVLPWLQILIEIRVGRLLQHWKILVLRLQGTTKKTAL